MYPSRYPSLYLAHLAIILICVFGGMALGVLALNEPMSLLLLLGLNFIPEFPLVPDPASESDDSNQPMYEGGNGKQPVGFDAPPDDE